MTVTEPRIRPAEVLVEALTAAMADLGPTPDRVAASLLDRGYQGCRGQSQHCPLANYLTEIVRRLTGLAYNVAVSPLEITAMRPIGMWDTTPWVAIVPSRMIHDFVNAFDDTAYPELIAQG